jgi:hypothetical protein
MRRVPMLICVIGLGFVWIYSIQSRGVVMNKNDDATKDDTLKGESMKDDDSKDDARIVENVRSAAKKGVDIKIIEEFVARKAALNTGRQDDKALYERVSIDIDAKESEIASLRGAKDVIYWRRPVTADKPKIIGIAYTAQGEMRVFFGVVLPP